MPLFDFLNPQTRMLRRMWRDTERRVLQARRPLNELLLLVVQCTTECSNFASTLVATDDRAENLLARVGIFAEYSALFCHLALRSAISKLPAELYLPLSEELFLFIPIVIADSFFGSMKEPDKSDCITRLRLDLISRAGFLRKAHDESKLVDLEKLIGLFALVSDAIVRKCHRESEWESLRNPLMDKVIEQWKLAKFDDPLKSLARNKRD